MWWKIYFWVMLVLSAIGIIFVYGQLEVWDLAALIEIVTSVIGLLGLYSVAYQKQLFSISFWKVFFWFVVASWVFNIVYVYTPLEQMFVIPEWFSSKAVSTGTDMLFGMVFSLPLLYAVYKLAYKK
jgi:hypothetical protein